MSTASNEYQKGYAAGRRKVEHDREVRQALDERRERVYMQSLELVVKHCSEWQIDGKKIDSAKGYCRLAKIFADNAISSMSS